MASQKKSAIRMLFDSMDRDGTGDLDIGEIKQLAEVLFDPDGNRQLTEDEYAIMMENMDEDGSGVVSFVEFSNWWVGLGLEVQMQNGHQVEASENHHHEIIVEISELEHMGSHIVYHFEVQVFGVPTYNFSNRYSNLLTVHKNMWNACCFDGLATALRAFPEKSGMFQNHVDDHDSVRARGIALQRYYQLILSSASVMQHPLTKAILGFDATDVDVAKARRKNVCAKRVRQAMADGGGLRSARAPTGEQRVARVLQPFHRELYGERWQNEDLPMHEGELVVVTGESCADWFKGYVVGRDGVVGDFPSTSHFVKLLSREESNAALAPLKRKLHRQKNLEKSRTDPESLLNSDVAVAPPAAAMADVSTELAPPPAYVVPTARNGRSHTGFHSARKGLQAQLSVPLPAVAPLVAARCLGEVLHEFTATTYPNSFTADDLPLRIGDVVVVTAASDMKNAWAKGFQLAALQPEGAAPRALQFPSSGDFLRWLPPAEAATVLAGTAASRRLRLDGNLRAAVH